MIDPILLDPKWSAQLADVLGQKYSNFLKRTQENAMINDPELVKIIAEARRELAKAQEDKRRRQEQALVMRKAKAASKLVAVFDANGKLIGVTDESKIQPLATQPVAKGRQVADPALVAAIVEARKLAARDQRRLPLNASKQDRDSAAALSTVRARLAGADAAKTAARRAAPNPGQRGRR